jgi:hypothetical protein
MALNAGGRRSVVKEGVRGPRGLRGPTGLNHGENAALGVHEA